MKGTNIYFNVARELINSNPKMKKIFEDKIKCSQRVCPPVSVHCDVNGNRSQFIIEWTSAHLIHLTHLAHHAHFAHYAHQT